jgi:hypothetical protein
MKDSPGRAWRWRTTGAPIRVHQGHMPGVNEGSRHHLPVGLGQRQAFP